MSTKKQFTEPSFARYPNGVIVRPECARDKSVCPLTGTVFKFRTGVDAGE